MSALPSRRITARIRRLRYQGHTKLPLSPAAVGRCASGRPGVLLRGADPPSLAPSPLADEGSDGRARGRTRRLRPGASRDRERPAGDAAPRARGANALGRGGGAAGPRAGGSSPACRPARASPTSTGISDASETPVGASKRSGGTATPMRPPTARRRRSSTPRAWPTTFDAGPPRAPDPPPTPAGAPDAPAQHLTLA